MKMKALARSVVRYFKRPAPSVPPEINLPGFLADMPRSRQVRSISIDARGKSPEQVKAEIQARISDLLRESIPLDQVKRELSEHDRQAIRAQGPGPINPHTGEPLPMPEQVPWEKWSEMRANTERPGWTFCRFACRTYPDPLSDRGDCTQVFGVVREHFGVFWQTFWSCHVDDRVNCACLIHLPTGAGVSIFEDMKLACDAAESLTVLPGIDWTTINPADPATYNPLRPRIESAFRFVGMHTAPYCIHEINEALDEIGPRLSLFLRDDPADINKGSLS